MSGSEVFRECVGCLDLNVYLCLCLCLCVCVFGDVLPLVGFLFTYFFSGMSVCVSLFECVFHCVCVSVCPCVYDSRSVSLCGCV